jgi:hypothetical protein
MAMRDFVWGNDVIVLAKRDGEYLPFAGVDEVKFRMTSPLIPSSSPDSGQWDEYRPSGKNGFVIGLNGVLMLQDENDSFWFPWETLLPQIRSEAIELKIMTTDNKGNVKYALCKAYIPDGGFSGRAEEFGEFDIQLQGSGPLDILGAIIPPGGVQDYALWIDFPAGATYVDHVALAGALEILDVVRGNSPLRPTNGAPVNDEFLFSVVGPNGRVAIDPTIPSNGEIMYVLYKK